MQNVSSGEVSLVIGKGDSCFALCVKMPHPSHREHTTLGGTTMGPSASDDVFPPNRPAPAVLRLLLLLPMLRLLLRLLILSLLPLLLLLRLLSSPLTVATSIPVILSLALSAAATATSSISHLTVAAPREACRRIWSPAGFPFEDLLQTLHQIHLNLHSTHIKPLIPCQLTHFVRQTDRRTENYTSIKLSLQG